MPCQPYGAPATTVVAGPVYQGVGDPYALGALAVQTISVEQCQRASPTALLIHAPTTPGDYPVVFFQHGYQGRNSAYDEILTHLASHGFVVVVPQMYEPGLGVLIGNPTIAQEADLAIQVLDWFSAYFPEFLTVTALTDRMGLAGHSRGGRVSWLLLLQQSSRFRAFAGIDPTDGKSGLFGDPTRVLGGSVDFGLPSLIIGAGVLGFCTTDRGIHDQYYAAAASPAWHVVATDYGHADMLDEDAAQSTATICGGGSPDREKMRRLVAGLLTAFFRGALQDDAGSFSVLTMTDITPAQITTESK